MIHRRRVLTGALALAGFPYSKASAEGAEARQGNAAIILVGASWCPVCKQAAPILALFAETRGLPVLVASADARPIPPFPAFVAAEGHPVAAGVSAYPTTFVFSASDNAVVGGFEGYRDPGHYVTQLAGLVDQVEERI